MHRSPKRSFDESSGSSATSEESAAKRSRRSRSGLGRDEDEAGDLESTPGLSAPGSSEEVEEEEEEEVGSVSSASSPLPCTPPPVVPPAQDEEEVVGAALPQEDEEEEEEEEEEEKPKALTRRQRKALGLPKPTALRAGRIVIPGGRYHTRNGKKAGVVRVATGDDDDGEGEWRTNGAGRVDVRGFRELKI